MGYIIRAIPTETYFSMVKEQLDESGRAYVRVTGTSMQPLLRHLRDVVTIDRPQTVRRGDIVLFDRRNGRYALHRVIRKGKTGFTMAGDNQWHMEKDLPYDQILGVVSWIQRDGRMLSCRNLALRIYTFLVTGLAFPRIYLWRAIVRLGKLVRRKKDGEGKGA